MLSYSLESTLFFKERSASAASSTAASQAIPENDDIMRTLLLHEKKGAAPLGAPREETSSSESEDDFQPSISATVVGNSEISLCPWSFIVKILIIGFVSAVDEMESEEEETAPLVTIGHLQVPYDEVTEEMISRMTPAEKEAFIKLGQDMYEDMYN